jgi:hypothetical protein
VPRARWSDERLDDLAKIVHHNDGRLDTVENMAVHATNELRDLKAHATHRARSRLEQAAIAAALASPIVTLILGLIYHQH